MASTERGAYLAREVGGLSQFRPDGILLLPTAQTENPDRGYNMPAWAVMGTSTVIPDVTPPTFSGLTTCGAPTSSTLTLTWSAATDDRTPQVNIVYDIYQATSSGGQVYTTPSYSSSPGATSYIVTGLSPLTTYYFVARARDQAFNRDSNVVERSGTTSAPAVGAAVYVF